MGIWKRNENGKRLIEECAANGWSIANTFFGLPKKLSNEFLREDCPKKVIRSLFELPKRINS